MRPVRNALKFCLGIALALPYQAHASTKSDAIAETMQAYSLMQLRSYLRAFDPNTYVTKNEKIIEGVYVGATDRVYLKKMSVDLVPPKDVKIFFSAKNELIIFSDGAQRALLSDFNVMAGTLKVNGQKFHYNPRWPLKVTVENLAELLQKKPKFSLYDLVEPRAHAFVAIAGGVLALALILAVPIALISMGYHELDHSLNEAVDACHHPETNVKFENSKISQIYATLKAKKVDLERLKETPTCEDWEQAPHLDMSPEALKRAGDVCVRAKEILDCINRYKAGNLPNPGAQDPHLVKTSLETQSGK